MACIEGTFQSCGLGGPGGTRGYLCGRVALKFANAKWSAEVGWPAWQFAELKVGSGELLLWLVAEDIVRSEFLQQR